MMLSSYIRSICEYILPPIILAGDLEFEKGVRWVRSATKKFLCIPANATEEALIMLTGDNIYENILKKLKQIEKKMLKYSTEWIYGETRKFMVKIMEKIVQNYNEIMAKPAYAKLYEYRNKVFEIGVKGKKVLGSWIIKSNIKDADECFPSIKILNSLLYRPLWFKAKTGHKECCKVCHQQWGYRHITECVLMRPYKELLCRWKADGFLRIDLFINKYLIKEEGAKLMKAYDIIKENTIFIK